MLKSLLGYVDATTILSLPPCRERNMGFVSESCLKLLVLFYNYESGNRITCTYRSKSVLHRFTSKAATGSRSTGIHPPRHSRQQGQGQCEGGGNGDIEKRAAPNLQITSSVDQSTAHILVLVIKQPSSVQATQALSRPHSIAIPCSVDAHLCRLRPCAGIVSRRTCGCNLYVTKRREPPVVVHVSVATTLSMPRSC